jgi:ferritin
MQEQLNNEFGAAYKYLDMVAYFEATPYKGFASWMRKQAQEEIEHAMKFFDYIVDRGNCVELKPIHLEVIHYNSPLEVFKEALAHEQRVTQLIHELYRVALEVNDFAAQVLLHWYIEEQVEEEKQVQDIIDQIQIVGDNMAALMAVDRAVRKRND